MRVWVFRFMPEEIVVAYLSLLHGRFGNADLLVSLAPQSGVFRSDPLPCACASRIRDRLIPGPLGRDQSSQGVPPRNCLHRSSISMAEPLGMLTAIGPTDGQWVT